MGGLGAREASVEQDGGIWGGLWGRKRDPGGIWWGCGEHGGSWGGLWGGMKGLGDLWGRMGVPGEQRQTWESLEGWWGGYITPGVLCAGQDVGSRLCPARPELGQGGVGSDGAGGAAAAPLCPPPPPSAGTQGPRGPALCPCVHPRVRAPLWPPSARIVLALCRASAGPGPRVPRAEPGPSAAAPLTHPTCGDGLLSWQGRIARLPAEGHPPPQPSPDAPQGTLALRMSRAGYGGVPFPQHRPAPSPPSAPPSLSSHPFHLSPGDGALVVVATPQSVPARCHGSQRCSEPNPRTPEAPPGPCPILSPLLHPGGALCQAWRPLSPQPGGWQCWGGGRAGGRGRPLPGRPPRSPHPHSCAMAIGEVRPCELRCPSPFPLSPPLTPGAMASGSWGLSLPGGVGEQPPTHGNPPVCHLSTQPQPPSR